MPNDVTPPAVTPPVVTPPAVTPPAAPWHGFTEAQAEDTAYVTNKGWKGPQDVITGYRNAEKFLGRDPNTLMSIPRADDPEGFRAAMSKLGLPESADKYEFSTLDGLTPDEGYMAWARGTFHKLGLPASTVKALTAEHNNYVAGILKQQKDDYNLRLTTDKAALQKEWGGGFERMNAGAEHAAKTLGFTEPVINAIESVLGYAGAKKMFADLGKKMGEDGFVSGTGAPRFEGQMTPAEAKVAMDGMMLDPALKAALMDKSHPGHAAAVAKRQGYFSIMYPA